MIKDKLDNANTYYGISDRLKAGFMWLKLQDLANIESKVYYIDNNDLYANVQEYETKDDADFETHKKYIDIQYMIRGKELVYVTNKNNCSTSIEYNEEKDLEFHQCNGEEEKLLLNEGEFLVLFPQDAHKPSITYMKKEKVKKVVVKVLID